MSITMKSIALNPLIWLILIAAILRIGWMETHYAIIEVEGGEYIRLAENIAAGQGYVGMREHAGPQIYFPPLFPIGIAALSALTHDYEIAGRAISIVAGIALVPIMFALALTLYGQTVAITCAGLVALHPMMVALSGTLYSESSFLTLLMGGIYLFVRIMQADTPTTAAIAGSGLLFGLAYLTRAEGFFIPFLLVGIIIISHQTGLLQTRHYLRTATLLLAVFLLTAAPYITWLTIQAGELHVEGKSPLNFIVGNRINMGMSYPEAAYGIDENLKETGAFFGRDIDGFSTVKREVSTIPYVIGMVRANLRSRMGQVLRASEYGGPLLIILACLGLAFSPWSKSRWSYDVLVGSVFAALLVMTSTTPIVYERYSISFFLPLALWASAGILVIWNFSIPILPTSHRLNSPLTSYGPTFLSFIIIGIITVSAISPVEQLYSFSDSAPRHMIIKEAGTWIRQAQFANHRIMAISLKVPYYAGAVQELFPGSSALLAIRYLERTSPDIVVLESRGLYRPYLRDWFEQGLPSPQFKKLKEFENMGHDKIVLYGHINQLAPQPIQ